MKKFNLITYGNENFNNFSGYINKINKVYALNPDAEILAKKLFSCEVVPSYKFYNEKDQKNNLTITSELKENFFRDIGIFKNIMFRSTFETLYNFFDVIISSFYFVKLSIINIGSKEEFLFYSNKSWIISEDKTEVVNGVFKNILNLNLGFFKPTTKSNYFVNFLINCVNNFILSKIKKKYKIVFISGHSKGLDNINYKILTENTNTFAIRFSDATNYRFLLLIRNIYCLYFSRKKYLSIPIVWNKNKNNFSTLLEKKFNQFGDQFIVKSSIDISININEYLMFTENSFLNIDTMIKKFNPSFLIADQLRWFTATNIGYAFYRNKLKVFLISHGSHVLPNDRHSQLAIKSHSRGMLFSHFATDIVLQSPLALKLYNSLNKKYNIYKSQPILWGSNKLRNFPLIKNKKNNISNIILYANTFKKVGLRPYIYNTSSEYIYSINQIIRAIKNIPNTLLVIRHRDMLECNAKNLEKLLIKSDKYVIKTDGSFIDDLKNCDLLISNSSTTVEEAIINFKPVALYSSHSFKFIDSGVSEPSLNRRYPIYNLENNNIEYNLISILKSHKNKNLTKEEINDYIWDSSIKEFSFKNFL